ncbi:DUF397 domain-containing protein [Streptomyces sp. CA-210063]|uniref:DUF397 domain-containing protein n=1 Tax=Streptomyces sp. CA-210063 TaxID=2801029 RepID=UPI00214C6865|nr:DUF397 domain-containing protein [Streptomyces sp. CA-210063]UUU32229.1 DUF397 domain-containing protein [Streptomyces sp. CA-210063]
MTELNWQKSSFSAGPEGECLYIATTPDGTLHLRESDAPHTILATGPHGLAALLRRVKAGPARATSGR